MSVRNGDALVSIGVPADKARAVVGAMEKDVSSNLATKADVRSLEQRVEHEFELVRRDMKALERSMTAKLGGMLAASVGLLLAALKLTI